MKLKDNEVAQGNIRKKETEIMKRSFCVGSCVIPVLDTAMAGRMVEFGSLRQTIYIIQMACSEGVLQGSYSVIA